MLHPPSSYPSLLCLALILLIGGCQPLTIDNSNNESFPLTLDITQDLERGYQLSWEEVDVSTFSEYFLVRGVDSLPFTVDPFSGNGLLVAQVDEQSQTSFNDEALPPANKLVYRLYANIGDRFLASNSVTVEQDLTVLNIRPRAVYHRRGDSLAWLYDRFEGKLLGYNLITNQALGYEITGLSGSQLRLVTAVLDSAALLFLTTQGSGLLSAYDLQSGQKVFERSTNVFINDVAQGPNGALLAISSNQILRYDPISQAFVGIYSPNQAFDLTLFRALDQNYFVIQSFGKLFRILMPNDLMVTQEISADIPQNSPSDLLISADGDYVFPFLGQRLYNRDLVDQGEVPPVFSTAGFGPQDNDVFYSTVFMSGGQDIALIGTEITTKTPVDTIMLQYTPRSIFSYENELVIIGEFCCDPNTFQTQAVVERFVP